MSLKKIDPSKIKISLSSTPSLVNEYKGNVNFRINLTNHVVDRFNEGSLNLIQGNLSTIKEKLLQLIYEKGIIGYGNSSQKFLALPRYGLFIVKEMEAVTFIGLKNMNSYYRELYIKLLNKGRVKY